MSKTPSCYFYVDYSNTKNPKEGRIWALCLEHGKSRKDSMYWDRGYGPFEIRCHTCGKLIWSPNENSNSTSHSC